MFDSYEWKNRSIFRYRWHLSSFFQRPSKAFDCFPKSLFDLQLKSLWDGRKFLRSVFSYLKHRKKSLRINVYSTWKDVLSQILQGSIFGSLLFNIFLYNLFLFLLDILLVNYAHDSTHLWLGVMILMALSQLGAAAQILLKWFEANDVKTYPNKYEALRWQLVMKQLPTPSINSC